MCSTYSNDDDFTRAFYPTTGTSYRFIDFDDLNTRSARTPAHAYNIANKIFPQSTEFDKHTYMYFRRAFDHLEKELF